MQKFANSWTLMKASWGILMKDKEMLLFPVISGITLIILLASFIVPIFLADGLTSSHRVLSGNPRTC